MALFSDAYAGRRVLITGHTGFKGAWLTAWLLRLGASVCGFSIDVPTSPALFDQCGLEGRIEHRIGDIRDTAELTRAITQFRPDFVLHLAAQAIVSTGYADPLGTISTNVLGTASLLQALRGVDWPCVAVFVASDKCYENAEQVWGYREIDALGGKDVYSGSKGAAEIVFHAFARSFFSRLDSPVRLASARAGNVIGGGDWAPDRIVADCIRAWSRGEVVQLRRPASVRPWQHVLDPLSGYLALAARLAGDSALNGESFNFGPRADEPRTVVDLIDQLAHVFGREACDAYRVLERQPFEEAGLLLLNCDKARALLKWSAVCTFGEAVTLTGRWYREVEADPLQALEYTESQIADYEQMAMSRGLAWAGKA